MASPSPSPTTWPSLNNYSLQGRNPFAPPDIDTRLGALIDDPRWVHASAGLYLTPTVFDGPEDVKRYLSLTYEPSVIHSWPAPLMQWVRDADRYTIENAYGEEGRFNRVWPAFGYDGGGLETILSRGVLPEPSFHGIDGGDTDHWRLDTPLTKLPPSVPPRTMAALAEATLSSDSFRPIREGEEGLAVKLAPESGIVINQGPPNGLGRQWTLSIGFSNIQRGVSLKFWGVAWEDVPGDRVRRIYFRAGNDIRREVRGSDLDKESLLEDHPDRFIEKFRDASQEIAERRFAVQPLTEPVDELELPAPFFREDIVAV